MSAISADAETQKSGFNIVGHFNPMILQYCCNALSNCTITPSMCTFFFVGVEREEEGVWRGRGIGGAFHLFHYQHYFTLKEWYKISSDTHWLKFCNRTSDYLNCPN